MVSMEQTVLWGPKSRLVTMLLTIPSNLSAETLEAPCLVTRSRGSKLKVEGAIPQIEVHTQVAITLSHRKPAIP